MENNYNDQKVIDLLSKLKNGNNDYPSNLLESRRQKYLQQVAQFGLGIGVGAGLKSTLKGRGSELSPTAGSWLEAVLVIAIVAEASTAAYLYRGKLTDLVQTFLATPTVQEVTSPAVISSPLPEISIVPTQTVTATATPTATGTPIPTIIQDNGNSDSSASDNHSTSTGGGTHQVGSTPDPKGNNGNHFGQTKQPPQATKQPKDTKAPNDQSANTKVPKNK